MKLQTKLREISSGGLQDTGSFTIRATGKAFRILSDGLYSDKITAIIRELSCNAWDSHIAAGKQSIPFHVQLPNRLDPTFKIQDFGIGLSHKDVMHLYTTYFESTKQDSNDFVGTLGLGSKSPFSYCDQFTVTSVYNGEMRMYTAYISENEVPSIAHIGTSKATGDNISNGLQISLPVKQQDFDQFRSKAEEVYKRFQEPLPIVKGNSAYTPKVIEQSLSGNVWKFRKNVYTR